MPHRQPHSRRVAFLFGGLGLALATLSAAPLARADVVFELPPIQVRLNSLRASDSDAPPAETERLVRDVRGRLNAQRGRIQRCLRGVDLRDAPFRTRRRWLEGTMTFERSTRPHVHVTRNRDMPPAAQACVLEAVRSIAAGRAPHGRIELTFRYLVSR